MADFENACTDLGLELELSLLEISFAICSTSNCFACAKEEFIMCKLDGNDLDEAAADESVEIGLNEEEVVNIEGTKIVLVEAGGGTNAAQRTWNLQDQQWLKEELWLLQESDMNVKNQLLTFDEELIMLKQRVGKELMHTFASHGAKQIPITIAYSLFPFITPSITQPVENCESMGSWNLARSETEKNELSKSGCAKNRKKEQAVVGDSAGGGERPETVAGGGEQPETVAGSGERPETVPAAVAGDGRQRRMMTDSE
ncbi:hypothetical protein V8G54_020116 [Vigna mungo]|uniref:Uncharacterized protein n=1 Tax=Vigna mungo TaxID=3915 RepID=A0AAQ3NBP1_VIGMU